MMKKLADINIGKKLGLILGGCVILLATLSAISLWGYRSIALYEDEARDRLTQQLLVDRVGRGVAEACVHIRTILSSKVSNPDEKAELLRVRRSYQGSLADFKARAD